MSGADFLQIFLLFLIGFTPVIVTYLWWCYTQNKPSGISLFKPALDIFLSQRWTLSPHKEGGLRVLKSIQDDGVVFVIRWNSSEVYFTSYSPEHFDKGFYSELARNFTRTEKDCFITMLNALTKNHKDASYDSSILCSLALS